MGRWELVRVSWEGTWDSGLEVKPWERGWFDFGGKRVEGTLWLQDDEMDVEIDEEAEEEHSAPAYPVVVALPATAPSAEETEPFETDESAATPPPHPAYRMTARITIPEPLPVPAWSDSEVARLLAISSPPASPLSPWSSSPP
ncbi:hypothetical protein Tco_0831473 [Tanacetum coccineum]